MGVCGGLYGGCPNGFKKILMGPGPEQSRGRSLIRHGYSIPPLLSLPEIPRGKVAFCLCFIQEQRDRVRLVPAATLGNNWSTGTRPASGHASFQPLSRRNSVIYVPQLLGGSC